MSSETLQHEPGKPGLIKYLKRTQTKYANRVRSVHGEGNKRHYAAIHDHFQAWIDELREDVEREREAPGR